MSAENFEISLDDWKEMLDLDKAFETDPEQDYRGAGEFIKTVFDNDSRIVIGRIFDATKNDQAVTFEKLSENYGGYEKYYERVSVLLAKRVYRYQNEKENKSFSFTPPESDDDIKGWFSLLYDGSESAGWKLRKNLEDAVQSRPENLPKKKILRDQERVSDYEYLKVIIPFLKNNPEGERVASIVEECEKNGLIESTTQKIIPEYSKSHPIAKGHPNDVEFYPNYFWHEGKGSPWKLTGMLDPIEQFSDSRNSGSGNSGSGNNADAKEILDRIKESLEIEGLTRRIHSGRQHYHQYVPDEDDGFYWQGNGSVHYEVLIKGVWDDPYEKRDDNTIYVELHIERDIKVDEKKKDELESKLKEKDPDIYVNKKWDSNKSGTKSGMLIRAADGEVKIKNDDGEKKDFDDILKEVKEKLEKLYRETDPIIKNFFNAPENRIESSDDTSKGENIILYGPPGTGKTYNSVIYAVGLCDGDSLEDIKKEIDEGVNYEAKLEDYRSILFKHHTEDENHGEDERIAFITFHQSYGYEEFIEGIKPSTQDGQIVYGTETGVFKEFCEAARENPNNNYVFIIDEINRGNISKIFGELITLIEPSKREGGPEGMSVTLPYSGDEFSVPSNVYILGTMNTADRSLALLDTALRRRFDFIEMMPIPDLLKKDDSEGIPIYDDEKKNIKGKVNLKTMLEIINKRIEFLYDREHTIGHAFFMPLLKTDKPTIGELAKIFRNKIIPLLQEYFYEDYEKIQLVLGDNAKEDQFKFVNDIKYESSEKLFMSSKSSNDLPDTSDKKCYEINTGAFDDIRSYVMIYSKESDTGNAPGKPGAPNLKNSGSGSQENDG